MAPKNAQSLIDMAEEKAAAAMDPEKFDFLASLEDDGIEMPTDEVKVFTNAKVHSQILTLTQEYDALLTAQAEQDKQTTDALRGARVQELAHLAQAAAARNAATPQEDVMSLVEEEAELEPVMSLVECQQQAVIDVPDYHGEPSPRAAELVDQLNELTKVAYADRLEITLEGLQPKVSQDLTATIEEELERPGQAGLSEKAKTEYNAERHANELLSRSITKIHNPKTGKTTDFSEERMPAAAARRLLKALPNSETAKLLVTAQTLTYAAVLIDLKTDAGFPGGRVEPEGEPVLDAVHQDSEGVG